jgi:hypothetical protein
MSKKRKKTEDEIREEEKRTTPKGLFNSANSYRRAASALHKLKLKTSHPHLPVSHLYYHAIELYLKAFLMMKKHTVAELRQVFGHSICRLTDRARQLGLVFDDQDEHVFSLMINSDAQIRARYLEIGPFCWPSLPALCRTCKSLHNLVGNALPSATRASRYPRGGQGGSRSSTRRERPRDRRAAESGDGIRAVEGKCSSAPPVARGGAIEAT